jgi:4-carboxymuconolactone decarboxylase
MARLPPADDTGNPDLAEVYAEIKATRGFVSNALRTLGHAPGGLRHFARVGEYVKYKTDLPERLRELTILTAARGVPYAWMHHRPLAIQTGIAEAAVDLIGKGQVPGTLPAKEQALVAYVMALGDLKVTDPVMDAMKAHFSARQIVDVALSATYYGALGRMVVAFGVDQEDAATLETERHWQKDKLSGESR